MEYRSLTKLLFTALFITIVHPTSLLAQGCQQRAEITLGADVFASPPRFVTGLGWQGNRQAYLTRGTQVYMCMEQRVEFGLSTKVWAKIAYRNNAGFQFGWVLKENVVDWRASLNDNGNRTYFGLVSVAYADDSPLQDGQRSEWQLGKAPTDISTNGSDSVALEGNRASTALDDLFTLYAPLFVAMLLGMMAKATVDWLDASDNTVLRQIVRSAFTAFLVSPIVFLGFLNAGEFSTTRRTFIVLCLLAFQNGFFWQTVLKKDKPQAELNAALPQTARSELSHTPSQAKQ